VNLLEEALSEYGHREIRGERDNPEVVKFFQEIGFSRIDDDETAWCSAYLNWVAMKAGMERTGKLNARSWLYIGLKVEVPQVGDIAIFYRGDPSSWTGHCGIFLNKIGNHIYVLGGNQANRVGINPYHVERLIGYRRLSKV